MIFSHVLYRLSYLGNDVCNRPYCNELGSPSVDDGASKDTVDRSNLYRPRVLGQWCDGIRIYAAASSPTRSRRT